MPNDNPLSRAYPTRASAETAAIRLLGAQSGYTRAEFLPTTITSVTPGAAVYEAVAEPECWRLVELSSAEVHRRQQSAIRREVYELQAQADKHEETARKFSPGRNVHKHLIELARELRSMACELETRIVVARVA